ncbi:hypothetical protein WA538_003320 [Blastocystis sp. DL]
MQLLGIAAQREIHNAAPSQRVRGIALQRDATTTRRSRVAKHVSFHSRGSANGCAKTTGIARSAMQLQRGYAAPSQRVRGIALQRDATTTRRSRVAKHVSFHSRGSANGSRCNYSAATPRPHYRFFSANALPRVSTTRGYAATHTRYARHTLASLAHSQEFISTSLFDSSMSALPIIAKQNSPSVGLFTH